MPSSIAHGLTAAAIASTAFPAERTRRLYWTAALGAVALDIDALGYPFGDGAFDFFWGHRALTHSLFGAAVIAAILVAWVFRDAEGDGRRWKLWLVLAMGLWSDLLIWIPAYAVIRLKARRASHTVRPIR